MTQPCVYIVQADDGCVKIGQTGRAKVRLYELRAASEATLSLVFVAHCSAEMTLAIEARVHAILAASRQKGEWFAVSAKEAVDAVMRAGREMCCPLELPTAPFFASMKRFRITKAADGKTPMHSLRVPDEMRQAIAKWAATQDDKPGASEAMRRLIVRALEAEAAKKGKKR